MGRALGALMLFFVALSACAHSHVATGCKLTAVKGKKLPASFDVSAVNSARFTDVIREDSAGSAVLRVQVLLDRAGFSPGEIDGAYGGNMCKAIAAFQAARALPASGEIEAATWNALNAGAAPALLAYTIRKEDVAGPFVRVPVDMMQKAKLKALNYQSPLEGISEKFHASPKLLEEINPKKNFGRVGVEVLVPNVLTFRLLPQAASVVVDKADRTVTALDAEGHTLAHFPATIGSRHDPLPIGRWKILAVLQNPIFHYNPDLFWDADPSHARADIAPGPNSPVGVVWISLSITHYGIHGTPAPSTIGRAQSHGCIRLTNWDAAKLAQMVAAGTPAILQE